MKNSLLLTVAFALFTSLLCAQTGTISGKIIDKGNAEGLIGAAVMIEKTTQGVVTDVEGNFTLTVASGDYNLLISFISYETAKVAVTVKANQIATVSLALEESKATLGEIIITTTAIRSTSTAMMLERKKAVGVSDGISADLIKKTPDRTTGDVLKRITGASIQEGKFAIIRGMNDRYNTGYLDGALLPSTESDRKAFAFDVVPANLLDNLTIYKAGTADVSGDFGGGIIKINTKAVPETFTQNLTVGVQMNSITTGRDFLQFKRYPTEGLNILGSERAIPDPVASSKFNNDWSNSQVTAMPNSRLAYSLGFPVKLKNNDKLGVILALTYSNTRRSSEGSINTFDGSGQVSNFNDDAFLQNISTGGIFNVNYVGATTQINFRNLLNTNTDNNVVSRTGTGNISDAITVKNKSNIINYNRLYNSILSLKQVFGESLTFNASVSYSNVLREVPDYRVVNYTKTPDFENYRLSLGDFFNSSTGRFASKLNENLLGGNIDVSKQFNTGAIKTNVKVGYSYQDRNRSFYGRSFVYAGVGVGDGTGDPAVDLGQANINAKRIGIIEKTANDLAYYNGKSSLNAAFISVDQKYYEKLRVVYGVRYEDINIKVTNEKIGTKIADIKEGIVLPSVNATYSLTEKTNLRASYFASVNRPEFRELAPFAFFVFDKNAEIRGNNALKIAHLNNYDVRYEFFPEGGQLVSVGGFYKTIANPIELSIDVSQPFTTFTFRNEKSATIYGLEFEIKKTLGFIGSAKTWRNLSIFSNLSLIKSQLSFETGTQAKQNRSLQGQSPFILNAGLQYENTEGGWSGSAVVNRVGRRIAYVGVDPKFGATRQDIYEAPRTVLDLQVAKTFKNMNFKLTIADLWHQDLTFYQDVDDDGKFTKVNPPNGDRLMFLYNNGFTATLSFGYNF